jgi:hypothetical protein
LIQEVVSPLKEIPVFTWNKIFVIHYFSIKKLIYCKIKSLVDKAVSGDSKTFPKDSKTLPKDSETFPKDSETFTKDSETSGEDRK